MDTRRSTRVATMLPSLAIMAIAASLATAACGRPMDPNIERERTRAAFADASGRLERARIVFAHQSVGENVVEGMNALQRDSRASGLHVVDLTAAETATGGFFAHARLGENGYPKGKTDAFVSALEGGLGRRADMALQKYCFVDIDAQTNVQRLFDYYRAGMNRIRQEFPHLQLVHVTAPLVHVQSGPRAVVKRLIGRTPDHYDDNIARERFNALMRSEYRGHEPVFDLAALEASRAGEPPAPFRFHGSDVFELLPDYAAADGAHLNEVAQKRIATELLVFLASVTADRDAHLAAR
jgi:hypothetical protein